ncbi:hypothetical protein EDB89DRAFT_1950690 [Lactarius sanguifluus]|nr:hypothetical protein EDB89DRAFT_1950690 [Lactarius sanguifluus]
MTSPPPATNQQPTGQGAATTTTGGTSTDTPTNARLYVIALFVPPIAVYFTFWINIAFCMLAWIPGVIHA